MGLLKTSPDTALLSLNPTGIWLLEDIDDTSFDSPVFVGPSCSLLKLKLIQRLKVQKNKQRRCHWATCLMPFKCCGGPWRRRCLRARRTPRVILSQASLQLRIKLVLLRHMLCCVTLWFQASRIRRRSLRTPWGWRSGWSATLRWWFYKM